MLWVLIESTLLNVLWVPVCRKSMDSVDIVHVPIIQLDNVHWVHGHCPFSPWTLSTQSMDNVHWIHGQCPLSPWTFFFPTLYLVKNYSNPTKLNAYIQFIMHVSHLYFMTYNSYMSINTDRPTAHNIKLYCFIYCAAVHLFITFWKIIKVIKVLLLNYKFYVGGKLDGVYCFLVYLNIMNN